MFRVIIDPGVLVAALISDKGAPRALLQAWIGGFFELLISPALIWELEQVLHRDKFRRYVTIADVRSYIAWLRRFATLAPDVTPSSALSQDPDDDYLLALAIAEAADFLISGDPHLTEIKNPPMEVLTPRAFLNRLPMNL